MGVDVERVALELEDSLDRKRSAQQPEDKDEPRLFRCLIVFFIEFSYYLLFEIKSYRFFFFSLI